MRAMDLQFCSVGLVLRVPNLLPPKTRIDRRGPLASVLHAASSQLQPAQKKPQRHRCSICALLSKLTSALDRCRNRWTSFFVGAVLAGCNRVLSAASAQRDAYKTKEKGRQEQGQEQNRQERNKDDAPPPSGLPLKSILAAALAAGAATLFSTTRSCGAPRVVEEGDLRYLVNNGGVIGVQRIGAPEQAVFRGWVVQRTASSLRDKARNALVVGLGGGSVAPILAQHVPQCPCC